MKDWKLIVVFDAAIGQTIIFEITKTEENCCGSSEDQAARKGE